MTNKFESLLELLINEENDKAEALFHEIVVEKSRDIYEGLAEEPAKEEVKEESKEENKEEVNETEASDEKKDEAYPHPAVANLRGQEGVFKPASSLHQEGCY